MTLLETFRRDLSLGSKPYDLNRHRILLSDERSYWERRNNKPGQLDNFGRVKSLTGAVK